MTAPPPEPDRQPGGPLVTDVIALLAGQAGRSYRPFLDVPAMTLGLFAVGPGHADLQEPHEQDEAYVVLSGAAVLEVAGERSPVHAGSVAYVPAGVQHRFLDVSEDLRVVVVFSPGGGD